MTLRVKAKTEPEIQGQNDRGSRAPKDRSPRTYACPEVRFALLRGLPKHWHSPLLVAIAREVRVELDLAVIGVPEQERHARPSPVAGDGGFVARDPDVGHVGAVHRLDPLRAVESHPQECRGGRRLGVAHVDGTGVLVRAKIDDLPAKTTLVVARQKPKRLLVGLELRPAPVGGVSALDGVPCLLEGLLDRVERDVEDDDHETVVREPGRCGTETREVFVGEAPTPLEVALLRHAKLGVRTGEHAVKQISFVAPALENRLDALHRVIVADRSLVDPANQI